MPVVTGQKMIPEGRWLTLEPVEKAVDTTVRYSVGLSGLTDLFLLLSPSFLRFFSLRLVEFPHLLGCLGVLALGLSLLLLRFLLLLFLFARGIAWLCGWFNPILHLIVRFIVRVSAGLRSGGSGAGGLLRLS